MKLKEPKNKGYCCIVARIDRIVPLAGCDNVVAAIVMNQQVVVSKYSVIGELGLFFPVETQLSKEYLSANNLYRENTLNADKSQKGYFEESGRIKAVKFRGHKSEGLFMPLSSLSTWLSAKDVSSLKEGIEFDTVNEIEICTKYVVRQTAKKNTEGNKGKQNNRSKTRILKNHFNEHIDTGQLKRNIHKVQPDDIISITNKLHGTSFRVGSSLVLKDLKWWEKALLRLNIPIITTEYDLLYGSRRVVKNAKKDKEGDSHYYGYDLRKELADSLKFALNPGMTIYGECVGFQKDGKALQKDYDYSCAPSTNKIYIYRITSTNAIGQVLELSWAQVKEFCQKYGLEHVPEFYYGKAKDMKGISTSFSSLTTFQEELLKTLSENYNLEKDCDICKNKVPAEGMVVRIDRLYEFEAYKLKSYRFLEKETKDLDKGIIDIESEESIIEEGAE